MKKTPQRPSKRSLRQHSNSNQTKTQFWLQMTPPQTICPFKVRAHTHYRTPGQRAAAVLICMAPKLLDFWKNFIIPTGEWAIASSSIWLGDLVCCSQLPVMLCHISVHYLPCWLHSRQELTQLEVPVHSWLSKSAPDDSLDTESKQEAYRIDPLLV